MAATSSGTKGGLLPRFGRDSARASRSARTRALFVGIILITAVAALPAMATEDTEVDEAQRAVLIEGAQTYNTVCASCHQAGGVGVEGSFPPLINNPRVDDTAYMEDVTINGLEGEIEVNGVTYNGVMPAFGSLTDEQVASLIAYIQAGFVIPGGAGPADSDAVASSGLPTAAVVAIVVAFFVVGAAVGAVVGPRYAGRVDRLNLAWSDAWLRAALIVIFFVAFVVYVPSYVMGLETVAGLDRIFQDIVGSGLWLLGLGIGLWALWYAHRDRRI